MPQPQDDRLRVEAALERLGAEFDSSGAWLLRVRGANQNHPRVSQGMLEFHPPVAPTLKDLSTEDRLNYETNRMAALRRALSPPIVPIQENSADAHRARLALGANQ